MQEAEPAYCSYSEEEAVTVVSDWLFVLLMHVVKENIHEKMIKTVIEAERYLRICFIVCANNTISVMRKKIKKG